MKLKKMTDFVLGHQKLTAIKDFDGYLISEKGIVIKLPYKDSSGKIRQGKILSIKIDEAGYCHCSLIKNHKIHTKLIHRLVANSFISESILQVNHKDGNKRNNHFSNLEYVTDKENKEHAIELGLFQKGSRNGLSKLNEQQVKEIKLMLSENNRTQKEIANIFNVTSYTISDIKNGKTWKHVK